MYCITVLPQYSRYFKLWLFQCVLFPHPPFYTSFISIHLPTSPLFFASCDLHTPYKGCWFCRRSQWPLLLTNDDSIMALFTTSAGLPFIALYFKLKQRQQSSIMARPDLYQRRWVIHTHTQHRVTEVHFHSDSLKELDTWVFKGCKNLAVLALASRLC